MRAPNLPRWSPLTVILAYLLLGILILFITPYDSFPDESGHYEFARYIHERNELPKLESDVNRTNIIMAFHGPLYYMIGALLVSPHDQMFSILALRFLSLLLGLLSLYFLWKTSEAIFPGNVELPILSVSIAALNPQFIFIHSGVTNISMLTFTCAVACWLIPITLMAERFVGVKTFFLGSVIGLAFLSRPTALYLFPACLLTLIVSGRLRGFSLTRQLRHFVLFGIGILLFCGWWFLRNYLLYGDPVAWSIFQTTVGSAWARKEGLDLGYLLQASAFLFASFWAYFGRQEFHATVVEYIIILVFTILSIIGALQIAFQRRGNNLMCSGINRAAYLILFSAAATAVVSIVLLQLRISSPQGRYLYMAISPIAVVLAAGFLKILPSQHTRWGSIVTIGLLFLMCLHLLYSYWLPHYV